MALEITGKIVSIMPEQTGQGQNGPWVKQQFVIETADRFPKKVSFIAWNDKAEMLSRLKSGDEVKVSFDLESREYNGRWYTDAKTWKIEPLSGGASSQQASPVNYEQMPPPPPDDLPF